MSDNFKVKEFHNEDLGILSYIVISDSEAAIIDPERNPQPYVSYIESRGLTVKWVILTSAHPDYVGSHAYLAETFSVPLVVSSASKFAGACRRVENGEAELLGKVKIFFHPLRASSLDNLVLEIRDDDATKAVFSGSALARGGVCATSDRMDPVGSRRFLAAQAFRKFSSDAKIFFGRSANSRRVISEIKGNISTVAEELIENFALKGKGEAIDNNYYANKIMEFEESLFEEMDHIVKQNLSESTEPSEEILLRPRPLDDTSFENYAKNSHTVVIDTRETKEFIRAHIKGSINLPLKNLARLVPLFINVLVPILLVSPDHLLKPSVFKLANSGYDDIRGYLASELPMYLHKDPSTPEPSKLSQTSVPQPPTPKLLSLASFSFISPSDLKNLKGLFLDIRTKGAAEALKGAIRSTTLTVTRKGLPSQAKGRLFVFADLEVEALNVCLLLKAKGIDAQAVKGGFEALKAEGFEVVNLEENVNNTEEPSSQSIDGEL